MRGISSRMRARCSGAVAPVTAPTSASGSPSPELGGHRREPLPQRAAVGELEVEHVGRARVGGAHEQERAGAALAGAGEQRLERVAAHQRVGGDRVGGQARAGPGR